MLWMAASVFTRYEKKYFVSEDTYRLLTARLASQMEKDCYVKDREFYTIANIYFDTAQNELVRISNSKPKYKEKLRLRSYGVPTAGSKVYLEIKKKVYGSVNKRRASMTLAEAEAFLSGGIRPDQQKYIDRQVLNEVEYLLERFDLEPKVYLAYDRKAYYAKDDSTLRITFDRNIRTRRHDLSLDLGDYGTPLLRPGIWLMEIKAEKTVPIWLTSLLSELQIYPASFSKYGTEYYMSIIEEHKGDHHPCLNPYLAAQLTPSFLQVI